MVFFAALNRRTTILGDLHMSLPDITATGNLAADPELKFFNDGNSVANFRIGCGARKKNRETGQWEDAGTTWLSCVARDGLAENIVTKFTKGHKIFVKGQLKQRDYEKYGQNRPVFDVHVLEVAEPINRLSDVDGAHQHQAWQSGQPHQSFQSSEAPF